MGEVLKKTDEVSKNLTSKNVPTFLIFLHFWKTLTTANIRSSDYWKSSIIIWWENAKYAIL